jgi:hypothetical protein
MIENGCNAKPKKKASNIILAQEKVPIYASTQQAQINNRPTILQKHIK